MKVLMDFKEQCTNIQYEIEDSKLYSRECEISTAYSLIDQFNSEVDDIQKQAQVSFHFLHSYQKQDVANLVKTF